MLEKQRQEEWTRQQEAKENVLRTVVILSLILWVFAGAIFEIGVGWIIAGVVVLFMMLFEGSRAFLFLIGLGVVAAVGAFFLFLIFPFLL